MATLRLFSVYALLLVCCLCTCLLRSTSSLYLNLTASERIELNRLFRSYNKPGVQEIKTIHGDTYSCVDFYKQPAFDHPLLKNHAYHLEMKFSPLSEQPSVSQESLSIFNDIWENGKGCPSGTIPVRKYTKEEYIRTQKLFQKLYPPVDPVPGRFRSVVHTLNGPQAFHGGTAAMNVYQLPVDNTQYTAGYMAINAGNDQLQIGWTCNPTVYDNSKTRIFLTTKVGNLKCFNLMCGGFVQTYKDTPLDMVLDPTTQRGNSTGVEIVPTIVKDSTTKLWTLYVTQIKIGFWPNEVLQGLAGPAEYMEWGGEAFNPPGNGLTGPGMGSGYFPEGQPRQDGYARQISQIDETGKIYNLLDHEIEMYSDNNDYYRVRDKGYIDRDFGHAAFYGGPGKQNPP